VLHAYLDESGVHDQSPIILVGGWIAPADLWAAFEPDWNEVLTRFGLTYFHASTCEAGDGIYRALSRDLRDLLFSGLAKVIAKHKPTAVYTAIKRVHFNETRARGVEIFDTPYHACFEFAIQQMARWLKTEVNGESVALVFAEHRDYEPQARLLYEMYRNSSRWGNELASLSFARPENFAALQAADLIVYEKTRHEVAALGNANIAERPVIRILADADVHAVDLPYDVEVLKELIAENESASSGQSA